MKKFYPQSFNQSFDKLEIENASSEVVNSLWYFYKSSYNLSEIRPLNFEFLSDFLNWNIEKISECFFQTEYIMKV